MTNVILASFEKEKQAIEAMHKLTQLESYGDISIYGKALVRKQGNGKFEILSADSENGWRTLTGTVAGSLIGALGGPVGFVVGLFTGTTIGAITDLGRQNFDESFIKKIESRIPPHTVSIIAEVDESSDIFVDNALKPYGADIERSDIDFEFSEYVLNEIDKVDKELIAAREELKNKAGKEKQKIDEKISLLKAKRNEIIADARKDARNFKKDINEAIEKTRTGFIKKRIDRYETKLRDLKEELTDISAK